MPTVEQFANTSTAACSTAPVKPLSNQIFDILLQQTAVGQLTSCESFVHLGSGSTIPFLQAAACEALRKAVQQKGQTPTLNHAYRAVPQQYVLFHWFKHGKCSITLAARPGTSPHEKAIAIDIADHGKWKSVLAANHWLWRGPSDPAHFTYIGGGVTTDIGVESVRAFQKLWNTHNPNDRIHEDGIYGEHETGPRLRLSPIEGF